jgi:hypothetical protein
MLQRLLRPILAFRFTADREHFHGDRSVRTTLSLTWLYRNVQVSYSRPWRPPPG